MCSGCGGRLPAFVLTLTSLEVLNASGCGLRGGLDRGLIGLSRLKELDVSNNSLDDLHSHGEGHPVYRFLSALVREASVSVCVCFVKVGRDEQSIG